MNPYLQNVEAMRKQGASDSDIEAYLRSVGAKEAEPAPRSAFSEAARGAALGLAEAGYSTIGLAGMIPGLGGVGEWAKAGREEAREFYDPRGGFGTAGQFVGRAAGEAAQAALGGPLIVKLLGRAAPGAAKTLQAGMASESALTRAGATMAANAPIDIAQGLKEEEGIVLPGRAGSVAENVIFSGAAGMLPVRRPRVPETRPDRLLPSRAQGIEGVSQYESPLGPAIPTRSGMPETRPERLLAETGVTTPVARQAYEEPIGPAIPMASGLELDPDEVTRRLTEAAAQAGITVPKPLIEVVESSARGSQPFRYDARNKTYRLYGTNRTQSQYLKSIEETADKLDKEAARLRAFQEPDMDAVAQLEAAAEAGRRMRDVLSPGGQSAIISPFATYDIGGLAGAGLKQALRDPVTGAIVGAGTGAMTGDTEDPYDIIGRAVTGAAVGAGVSRAAGRRLVAQRRPVPGATEALDTRTPYQKGLAAEKVGTRKASPLNVSVQLLDPTGKRMLEQEVEALEKAGYTRRAVSDAEIDRFAVEVDIPELVKADVRKLDTVQIAALGRRIAEDRTVLNDMVSRLDDSGLTDVERAQFEQARDAAMERLVSYDRLLDTAGSEQGRGLRMLGRIMRQSGAQDINQAYKMAKQMTGLKPGQYLSEVQQASIRDVFTNPKYKTAAQREEQLAKVLGDMQKGNWWDVVLDWGSGGLLSAPVSFFTNIYGSTAGAVSNAIGNPMSAIIDNALVSSGILGREAERTVMARTGRAGAYAGKFKESLPKVLDKRRYQGLDPEKPLAEMQRKKINYINSLGLSPQEGELAWRKTLRGAAKIIEVGTNAVYGMMQAFDVPFFDGALAASLKERATMRAMKEMPNAINSDAFFKRIEELMDPLKADPVDATMALAEAMDATFKTPTATARLVRAAGPLGRYVSPFTNTVTNLVRRGFEDIPFVGFIPSEIQARDIKAKLEGIKASPVEIAREMRRYRTKVAGRQLTTGIGAISAGYLMSRSGRLTGEYVEPAGATPEEQQEMKRQRLTGQAPLTLRVGDEAYSLAPFAFLIPGIVIGAALQDAFKDEDVDIAGTAGKIGGSMARTVLDLPVLQGIKNLTELPQGNVGEKLGRETTRLLPFSALIAATGRAMDPVVKREAETYTEAIKERLPFLREELAPAVNQFGEVTTREQTIGTAINVLANPFRPTPVRTGALYDALQALETTPPMGPRRKAGETQETQARYAERRQLEGPQEKALLEGLLAGDPQAWAFVPEGTRRKFFTAAQRRQTEQGAWRELLSGALSAQRSAVTSYDRQQAERKAILEGFPPNTVPFTDRVKQLMAGQP